MKRIVLTVLMVGVLVAGCVARNDPRLPLVTAVDGYAATVNVLAEARRAGRIDDAKAERIEEYRALARSALDSWSLAVESGLPPESAARQFNEAMRLLLEERLKVESQKREGGL
jgi:outer membrane murein-binding lipoprotein Lpp